MVDQLKIEKKWQAHWHDQGTFTAKPGDKPKYFGTVPYPYANSALHIGHGRTSVAADILYRYQRVLGKNVLYPLAFHISGTPVLAVADGVARGDKKTIKLTRDAISYYVDSEEEIDTIISGFDDVQNIADFFSSKIIDTFASVGLGMDYSKVFSTGDLAYQKFVQWQFKQLEKHGMLKQGKYPILFSPKDENAVGEDDIKDGDTDKVSIQEMTYVLFKRKNADDYFCVATLRPDALFGTTNLWVDPRHTIQRISVGGKKLLVNKEVISKFTHQFDDITIGEELEGKDVIGETFITPLVGREIIVAKANFVDPAHGTGLVYSSPAGSPHDYIGLQEAKADGRLPENLEAINTVTSKDKKGNIIQWKKSCPAEDILNKYGITSANDPKLEEAKQELYKIEHYGGVLNELCEHFAGIPIKNAKEKIHAALVNVGLGGTLLEPSRQAVTRSGHKVIIANLDDQWFLDYGKDNIKKQAHGMLSSMNYFPENMRQTQSGYLDWVQKRPCARKRGIGTPLPQDQSWTIEPLSDSTMYPLFYILAGMINDKRLQAEDITDELLNYFYLDGEMPSKPRNAAQLKKEVHYWKNFDSRYTNAPHLSNHLSFLIYHNAVVLPQEFQPKGITVGGLLIKDGKKISKSKGNGVPLIHVREKYGADLYRLYVAVGASLEAEMDFRDEEIYQLEKKFSKWKELLLQAKKKNIKSYEEFSGVDKWLISKFYSRAQEYFLAMEKMDVREAYVNILYEFLNDINYHARRSDMTADVLAYILYDYACLMTPVVPHICEELLDGNAAHAKFSTDCAKYIDTTIESQEELVQEVLTSIDRFISEDSVEIEIQQATEERFLLFDTLKKLLADKIPPKKIMGELMKKYGTTQASLIKKFVPKTFGSGLHTYFSYENEKKLLEELTPYLEKIYGVRVHITRQEGAAKPGQPTVRVY